MLYAFNMARGVNAADILYGSTPPRGRYSIPAVERPSGWVYLDSLPSTRARLAKLKYNRQIHVWDAAANCTVFFFDLKSAFHAKALSRRYLSSAETGDDFAFTYDREININFPEDPIEQIRTTQVQRVFYRQQCYNWEEAINLVATELRLASRVK